MRDLTDGWYAWRNACARNRAIEAFLADRGGRLEDYLYLPLKGNNQDIVMVLSPENGLPVGSISISPWLEDYRASNEK